MRDLLGEGLIWLLTGGVGVAVIQAVRERRKLRADAAGVLSAAAVALVAPLEKRITELQRDLDAERATVTRLRNRVAELERHTGGST